MIETLPKKEKPARFDTCSLATQRFYELIEPLLKRGHPYGYLVEGSEEIAAVFGLSVRQVRFYIGELRRCGYLRQGMSGYYSPIVIRTLFVSRKLP